MAVGDIHGGGRSDGPDWVKAGALIPSTSRFTGRRDNSLCEIQFFKMWRAPE